MEVDGLHCGKNRYTVKSAYKELPVIRKCFLFPNLLAKTPVHYTFIRNSGYKEQIFMVLMISFY